MNNVNLKDAKVSVIKEGGKEFLELKAKTYIDEYKTDAEVTIDRISLDDIYMTTHGEKKVLEFELKADQEDKIGKILVIPEVKKEFNKEVKITVEGNESKVVVYGKTSYNDLLAATSDLIKDAHNIKFEGYELSKSTRDEVKIKQIPDIKIMNNAKFEIIRENRNNNLKVSNGTEVSIYPIEVKYEGNKVVLSIKVD